MMNYLKEFLYRLRGEFTTEKLAALRGKDFSTENTVRAVERMFVDSENVAGRFRSAIK